MSEVTVVVHIHARPGQENLVGQELAKLIGPTRAEPGCKQYDLLTDMKDPTHFVYYENWDSAEAHQSHMDSEHIASFVMACRGAIAEATTHYLNKMEQS